MIPEKRLILWESMARDWKEYIEGRIIVALVQEVRHLRNKLKKAGVPLRY